MGRLRTIEISDEDLILVELLRLKGYEVVEAKRLELLERLATSSRRKKKAMHDAVKYGGYDYRINPYRREEVEAWNRYENAEREIFEIVKELEERMKE